MALKRCPKCQSIIDSEDVSCHYCGFQLKKVAKEVALPSKDSLDIDSEKFESITGDKTLNEKHAAVSTNDDSKTGIYKKVSAYSNQRVRDLRWSYFAVLLVSSCILTLGIVLLILGIKKMIDFDMPEQSILGSAFIILGLPLFIYCLFRFIQSFKNPILVCETADKIKESTAADIAEVAVGAAIEVICDIID